MPLPPPAPAAELIAHAAEGGRAAAVASALEAALTQALAEARPGDAGRLSALNLEVTGAVAVGAPLRVRAWVERATRTLAFVSGEVFDGAGERVASGAGVFEFPSLSTRAEFGTVAAAD